MARLTVEQVRAAIPHDPEGLKVEQEHGYIIVTQHYRASAGGGIMWRFLVNADDGLCIPDTVPIEGKLRTLAKLPGGE